MVNNIKNGYKNQKKMKERIFIIGMLMIPVIHFIIFWIGVNFNSILMAFQDLDPVTNELFFTTDNFPTLVRAFQHDNLKTALINTLLTFGLTLFLMPWGFFLTYFLYKKIKLSNFWLIMLFIPSVLPAVALTAIFSYLIYSGGPIGLLFGSDCPSFLTDLAYARWTVLIYIFWTNFGGSFILYSGAMSRIPKEIFESANIDGAGLKTEMLKLVLPLCWPTISMLLLLNISGIFTATGPILFLTEGMFDTVTISYWIFHLVHYKNLYVPAALGIVCTLIIFPVVVLTRWGLGKIYRDVEF